MSCSSWIVKYRASMLFSRSEKRLLALLASINFVHIIDFMIMMPLGPQLMRVFDISTEQFGMLVACYSLSAGISGFLASFYMDRFDRKSALLCLFFGFIIGTLACGVAPNYEFLLITRTITGFFGGVLGSLVLAIVGDTIDYQRRGSAMGLIMSAFSLASVMGVPFSLMLANLFDWHAPFFMLGALSGLIFGVALSLLPKLNSHLSCSNKMLAQSPFSLMRELIKNRNQMIALIFMGFMTLGHFMIIPYISPSMVMNVGFEESQLPLIYLVGGLASMVTGPWIGRLADKFGKHQVFTFSGLVVLVPLLLLTHLNQASIFYALILVALFFVFSGGRMIPASALVSETVPPERRGGFMSLVSSMQNLSAAIASFLASQIVIKAPNGQLDDYNLVGYLASIVSLVAVYLAWKIDTRPRP